MTTHKHNVQECDVLLIGAGVMSATLGVFLAELQPELNIAMVERLDRVAAESSDAWNNAGTGHSGLCELNYAPQAADGSVDVSKAVKIAEKFEVSKQFWSYLTDKGYFKTPSDFINSCPHMSLVWGDENVDYLQKRFHSMEQHAIFKGVEYSDEPTKLKEWIPLVMEGREGNDKIAATRTEIGTDVNFGALTRNLVHHLTEQNGLDLRMQHEVRHLHQEEDGRWLVDVHNLASSEHTSFRAKFVFIGAGGGSLPLLEKSHISEGKGFAGFPVSGQWLRCTNKAVIEQHHAKVYGKAAVGAPPMSVPHLDTRVIDGERAMLFGPYAGFSTKFLKEGSWLDLPLSVRPDNIVPLLGAGLHNIPLTEYLVGQVLQSDDDRFKALQEYFPGAIHHDWELVEAGQRVQVIKKDAHDGGVLEFGTEVVTHADGSIAALLGASPGASTSVSIMLEVLDACFRDQMQSPDWVSKLKEMIPTYGLSLDSDPSLCAATRTRTHTILGLHV